MVRALCRFLSRHAIITARFDHLVYKLGNTPLRTRLRSIALLIGILLIALILTVAMSDAILARSTFQSSPVLPTDTPVVAQLSPTPTAFRLPAATPTTVVLTVTPASPPPTAVQPPTAAVAPSGFLPAPTLTNPDGLLPAPSTAQPPLVGPAVSPVEPTPLPDTGSGAPGVAELIDNGIVAFSYVWLCCGALFLGLLALVVVWLTRRGARR